MSDKPEALLLAGQLESGEPVTGSAAAELRRLHKVNQELLEAAAANEMETRGKLDVVRLYAAPPPRKPLTDEKLRAMWVNYAPIIGGVLEFARAIEAAHGIGV